MLKRYLREPVLSLALPGLVSLIPMFASLPAAAEEPTAAGLWQKVEKNKPVAWFVVRERSGVYEGAIAKTFPQKGEVEVDVCSKCTDDRRGEPVLGINFIRGMKKTGLDYENGNILDPRDGTIYKAKMRVSPDGKELTVRGYVGISLLGKDETWHRLPDTMVAQLDESVREKYYPELSASAKVPAATKKAAPRATTGSAPTQPNSAKAHPETPTRKARSTQPAEAAPANPVVR